MRFPFLPLPAFFLLLSIPASDQSVPPGAPVPRDTPGKMEIAKHPLILEEPAQPRPQKPTLAALSEDADELARLAQTVPDDMKLLAEGKISKDLPEKLKRIEKLSKNLRKELAP